MWSKINAPIDNFLNGITMYRLVLYVLLALVFVSFCAGLAGVVPFSGWNILLSASYLTIVCLLANWLFAWAYEAPLNTESVYITALILALIVSPATTISGVIFLTWVAVLAMASKFILSYKRKHIFNPAAIAVVLTAFGLGQSASWWVGNVWLLVPVTIGGYLIVRKIQRAEMVWNFLLTVITLGLGLSILKGTSITATLSTLVMHSSLLFFAGIMLTEPLTSPRTIKGQALFGLLVGFLFIPQVHLGSIYATPELALVVGNLLAFLLNPDMKLVFDQMEKIKLTSDTYNFVFPLTEACSYRPGQYMEWTLAHPHVDDRGNRRYFTLASSPTENNLRIGIKFYQTASSYKKALLDETPKVMVASQIAGDFTLPRNPNKKCVFLAGGIGVTPFRSMLKYLVDKKEKRDIVLVFANKTAGEIVYKDVFDEAQTDLGIKTVYTLTDVDNIQPEWNGKVGRVDEKMIREEIPDFAERLFYLSGPRSMVMADEVMLKNMGVKPEQIKIDYFPGFA